MDSTSSTIDVALYGVWCEAEATTAYRPGTQSPYTEIYIATSDGYPMYEAIIAQGHLTDHEVRAAIEALAAGRPSAVEWVDLRRSAA